MRFTPVIHRFPNGLTLAIAPMPDMASVSVGLWVGVGGRHESAALNGVSHFIEHMLFKGTRRRSARDISEAVEGVGGYLNAFTSEETTCFYAKAPRRHLVTMLDVLADLFLDSVFAPRDLATEREVIREELAMYRDQPHHHVEELLNVLQWPGHPLGRPLTGTEATLPRLTRERLLAFRRQHHVAPAIVIAVAGGCEPGECRRAVARWAKRFQPAPRPGFEPVRHLPCGPVVKLERRRIEQTQLALGVRTCSRHDPRRYALRLLNVLLGENASSRLFQTLREERGITYHVASSLSFFQDAGDLVIAAGLEPGRLEAALKLIVAELRRLKTRAPGPAEMRRAREYVAGQMDLSLENSENQMMWLGEQWLGYGRLFPPDAIRRELLRVAAAEVRAAAADFFRPERVNLALVGPHRGTAGAQRILTRL
jgi:predicted Zn-dependent peptidase